MKRVTLNIDLEDNTIFENEVIEIIKAKSREIARNHQNTIIEDIISSEVRRMFANNLYNSYGKELRRIVEACISNEIRNFLVGIDVKSIAEEEFNRQIEFIISRTTSEVEEKCIVAFNRAIANEIVKKLPTIFEKDGANTNAHEIGNHAR